MDDYIIEHHVTLIAISMRRKRVSSMEIEGIGIRTISIGITEFKPADTAASIFKRADNALYEAKETGKNKMCVKY